MPMKKYGWQFLPTNPVQMISVPPTKDNLVHSWHHVHLLCLINILIYIHIWNNSKAEVQNKNPHLIINILISSGCLTGRIQNINMKKIILLFIDVFLLSYRYFFWKWSLFCILQWNINAYGLLKCCHIHKRYKSVFEKMAWCIIPNVMLKKKYHTIDVIMFYAVIDILDCLHSNI